MLSYLISLKPHVKLYQWVVHEVSQTGVVFVLMNYARVQAQGLVKILE